MLRVEQTTMVVVGELEIYEGNNLTIFTIRAIPEGSKQEVADEIKTASEFARKLGEGDIFVFSGGTTKCRKREKQSGGGHWYSTEVWGKVSPLYDKKGKTQPQENEEEIGW